MAWTQRVMLAGAVGLAALFVFGGRRDTAKAGLAPKSSAIKGAVYAGAVPVFPGAKLTDIMGGDYMNEIGGPVMFKSQSWFFSTDEPMAKVVEWYRKNLPEGAKPMEVEQGEVGFEWTPPGAVEGEEVSIRVREGELQIGEVVKAGKGQ